MKQLSLRLSLFLLVVIFSFKSYSQSVDLKDVNTSNTWLKVGLNAGVPIGEASGLWNFTLGLDANVQYLPTKAYGIGLKTGYTNYFGKGNANNLEVIPLAILFRYYPKSSGLFVGLEAGYAFILSELSANKGGIYARPHIGWHTNHWNFFGYYDYIQREENLNDLQSIGLGITYNIYLNK